MHVHPGVDLTFRCRQEANLQMTRTIGGRMFCYGGHECIRDRSHEPPLIMYWRLGSMLIMSVTESRPSGCSRYTLTITNDGRAVLEDVTVSDPSLVAGVCCAVPRVVFIGKGGTLD